MKDVDALRMSIVNAAFAQAFVTGRTLSGSQLSREFDLTSDAPPDFGAQFEERAIHMTELLLPVAR